MGRVMLLALIVTGCRAQVPHSIPLIATETRSNNLVLRGAARQLENPAIYDAAYLSLKYPNGDPPINRGACTDVVIRAIRFAGHDLQALVHEDQKRNRYPHIASPDPNIDHRRVLNLETFFKLHARVLTTSTNRQSLKEWKPGDIVSWRLPMNKTHIGIVSDRKNFEGTPLVIHNIGRTCEEDSLLRWTIAGHFRYPI